MVQATARCPKCNQAFGVQLYEDTNQSKWTLFSDGFRHFPNDTPLWHELKECPHCKAAVKVSGELTKGAPDSMPFGDAPSPRHRVRAHFAALADGDRITRRDLMLLDLWVSNHICGNGPDEFTRSNMRELLDPDNGLDPLVRADIQRQLGRFEAAREGLLSLQRASKSTDRDRKIHIKSVLALISRSVRESVPVHSDSAFMPPTGRLALNQFVTNRY